MAWQDVVRNVAPTLGTMLGGPLAGTAITALSELFLGKPDGKESEVGPAILAGMSPENVVALRKIDKEHEEKMAEYGIDLAKLSHEKDLAYISDTQDARKYKDDKVFWMGVVILLIFAAVMVLTIYGSYQLLIGGITVKDVATVGIVSGFLGTVIGYVAANAQQVVGYFYGSSAGSANKTDAMANSFQDAFKKK